MRDVMWRLGFTLMALGVLLLLGPGVSCNLDNRLMDGLRGPAPESEIQHYLAAVAEGDRHAALGLWLTPGAADDSLEARRSAITEELLGFGPRLEYRVLDMESLVWSGPDETGDAAARQAADAVRFRVAISGENRPETVYLFDIMQSSPGSDGEEAPPANQAAGPWAIVDVYPQDAVPLAWNRR